MAKKSSKKIGFIGAGKVGHSLGKYLTETFKSNDNFAISGYYSKSVDSAESASKFTDSTQYDSINNLIENSDIIFITVPDGVISSIWDEIIKKYSVNPFAESKIFCHCSGSLTSNVFDGAKAINAYSCSLHPMYAVADKFNTYKELSNAYFTFEGNEQAHESMSDFLSAIPNNIGIIDASKKTLYHAACVFFSNLVVGISKNGEDILRDCGLDEEFAQNAWRALFLDNAKHVSEKGPDLALTGPAERGDENTIRAHITELQEMDNKNMLDTYCLLTKSVVQIAKKRHPERDYSAIEKLLLKK